MLRPAGHDDLELFWAHQYEPPPVLSWERDNGILPAADEVLKKVLAKAPEDCYGTCLEFVAALCSVLAECSAPQGRTPTLVDIHAPRPRCLGTRPALLGRPGSRGTGVVPGFCSGILFRRGKR
ncbi:hypothetical protein [Streptomyces sp. NPDC054783]